MINHEPKLFTPHDSRKCACLFLEKIAAYHEGHGDWFSPKGMEQLRFAIKSFFKDSATEHYWTESNEISFGVPFIQESRCNEIQIYTMITALCARCTYELGVDLSEMLKLLFSIKYLSKDFPREYALWRAVIDE